MADSNAFDLLIIGAGPGGYTAAAEAGKLGFRTGIIEEREVGGTCLNRGCIPTKALLHASGLMAELRKNADLFGKTGGETEQADFSAVAAYRDQTVKTLRDGIEKLLQVNHVKKICGRARIAGTDADGVRVVLEDGTEYRAKDVILATGSSVSRIPVPGITLPGVVTSDELLSMDSLPGSLLIVGGGVIGCEFACCMNEFGVPVTIVEALPRILANMDKESAQNLKMIFKKRGVEVYADQTVKEITKGEDGLLTLRFQKNGTEEINTASAEYVLVATGRRANTGDLFTGEFKAEGEALLKTERGRIPVDRNFATGLPHVYAIGDIVPGIQLAHNAEAEGKQAVRHLAFVSGKLPAEGNCRLSLVPMCVYTDPEIASVGMTEEEAKNAGIPVKTGKAVMGANAKSVISREDRGFMKFVAEAGTGKLLGAQFMCARASDLIGEAALALANDLSYTACLKAMRAHPTYEEAMTEALEKLSD
jgi:dihydrolipoamide dehydrogenase